MASYPQPVIVAPPSSGPNLWLIILGLILLLGSIGLVIGLLVKPRGDNGDNDDNDNGDNDDNDNGDDDDNDNGDGDNGDEPQCPELDLQPPRSGGKWNLFNLDLNQYFSENIDQGLDPASEGNATPIYTFRRPDGRFILVLEKSRGQTGGGRYYLYRLIGGDPDDDQTVPRIFLFREDGSPATTGRIQSEALQQLRDLGPQEQEAYNWNYDPDCGLLTITLDDTRFGLRMTAATSEREPTIQVDPIPDDPVDQGFRWRFERFQA